MKITDNFLDDEIFQQLKSAILSPIFDWNYVPMTDSIAEKSDKFSGQFVHLAYSNCIPKTTFFNSLILHIQIVYQKLHFSIVFYLY